MKLTKQTLKQIIKEELSNALLESPELANKEQLAKEAGLEINPHGGRFYYVFTPVGNSGKGILALYHVEEQTNEMEFASAEEVQDLDQELRRVASL